jgi:hypothetical protein
MRSRSLGVTGTVTSLAGLALSGPVLAAASAVPPASPPLSLQQLVAATPRAGAVSPAPGETVAFSDAAWVRHELQQPWLTPAERAYLEALPVAASAPSPAALSAEAPPSLAAAPAGDPVMSGGCNFEDALGVTIAWFHAYLGFSDNGTKITQVSTPNNYEWESALSLNTITYDGSTFATSQPDTEVGEATAKDTGLFTQSFGLPLTSTQFEADIYFDMEGSGAWSSHPVCTTSA